MSPYPIVVEQVSASGFVVRELRPEPIEPLYGPLHVCLRLAAPHTCFCGKDVP